MQPLIASLEQAGTEKINFDCTRRACAPRETVERMTRLFPLFGLTRLANITGLDKVGIPVYAAYRPNARSLSVAQGKGCTQDAARASAVMESIESYHAENIQRPLLLASYEEMYERALDISRLPRYHDAELDGHRRILWIEGIDLFTNREKWSPFEVVHTDYAIGAPAGNGFVSSSNGLSSGNNHHEAIIHGLCEVIERDALTLWTISPAAKQLSRKIRLESVTERQAVDILERFISADISVGIWDMTSDTGIPSFLCRTLPREADITGARPASGMGCHLSRDVALLRALTEAAQSRLTFISGARDDMPRADYAKYLSVEEHARWLAQIDAQGARHMRHVQSVETETFDHDIVVLVNALRKTGIREAVAIDLTIDGLDIPVTRMVVPGLEGILSRKGTVPGERAGRILPGEPNA